MMSLSVLIADESAAARENLIAAMPEDWNVSLSEAASSDEALDACTHGRAAVMFLDLTLPGMSGVALMDSLQRANAATVVIVVADADAEAMKTEARAEARAHGAVAFVEKPIRRETLEPVLKGCGLYGDSRFH